MEDFLKSAGYTKSEITTQLQKLGTTAKQNVYNFYGEKNHFGDAVVQNYALHKSQNYITNGSRKYFSENKPYEDHDYRYDRLPNSLKEFKLLQIRL
jgi:hypothetical protein